MLTPEMQRKADLTQRISRLTQLSAEMELHIQKLTDNPEELETLEAEYQDLFADTVETFSHSQTGQETPDATQIIPIQACCLTQARD